MTAFVIVYRKTAITDTAAIAEYSRRNQENVVTWREAHGIKPVVVYGKSEAPEGENPDGIVLLEFPTVEAARGWYNSPEYQAAIPFREQAAQWQVVIVDGIG